MEVPGPPLVLPAVEVVAGAAGFVVVAVCDVEAVVTEAALSGTLNKLPNGALVVAADAVDEEGG